MSERKEQMAERINWVIQNTPFEKLTPELWANIQAGVVKVGDHYDEDTPKKVQEVIRAYTNLYLTYEIMTDLQNKGILFRERHPG